MTPISSYTKDNHLRVVLQGPPGSGKSVLAMRFPRPYFIDLDVNLGGPLRWAERTNSALPVGYDVIDRDDEGKPVDPKQRYLRLKKKLEEAAVNPDIDTVVLDSATMLADVLIEEVLRQQGKNKIDDWKDPRQFWGFFFPAGRNFMGILTQMRKHVIMTAHEKLIKNPDGSIAYPIKVSWPGQLGQIIGAFFTDVWRCETESTGAGAATKTSFVIRTMPNYQYELKNSLGLPAVFPFDWKTIETALNSTNK